MAESNYEAALKDAGFELTNEPPTGEDVSQQNDGFPEGAEVIDLSGEQEAPVQEEPQQVEEEAVSEEVSEEVQPEDVLIKDEDESERLDIDGLTLSTLSERLGTKFNSFEEISDFLNKEPEQQTIDERVQAIADFVNDTGRDPKDWFYYQSLDPSEMDDMAVVKNQMKVENPYLSSEEVDLLVNNKYKLDDEVFDENEVKLSKLQLKMDAEKGRTSINSLRDQYKAPIQQQAQQEETSSPIDEQWVDAMTRETNDFEALSFDIGENEFDFKVSDDYKRVLVEKNANLENYFDEYVSEDGSWDYDLLNSHRALIDNIDEIVNAVYQQGLGDGQRGLVEKTANVSMESPQQTGGEQRVSNVAQQLSDALGMGNNTLTVKI
tara:strand:+ start:32 stop:1165 length:1134 start_codon:yes stop_codon:yes gene_type:complete